MATSSTSESSSEESINIDEEKKEELPSTWKILGLCKPERELMIIGVFAAICVGASFPTFAVLFGETYGVSSSLMNIYIVELCIF